MCGISCLICTSEETTAIEDLFNSNIQLIKNRGPDRFNIIKYQYESVTLKFAASVLWLQGKNITTQPIVTKKSIFLYNGDLFNENIIDGDTQYFVSSLESSQNIMDTLNSFCGPYAFIYLDKQSTKLYFSRDKLGRRSLVLGKDNTGNAIISSVCMKSSINISELDCDAVYCIDLRNVIQMTKLPYKKQEFCIFIEPTISSFNNLLIHTAEYTTQLYELLVQSIKSRLNVPQLCKKCIMDDTCTHSKVGILFSGGIDCTIIAALMNELIPKADTIDLMNVAFDKPHSQGKFETPDRKTGLASLEELKKQFPDRKWNFIEINVSYEELNATRKHISNLIFPLNTILDDSLGCALWFAARGKSAGYESPVRVGMGADELFGGYSRHRAAFKHGNWSKLHEEMLNDWLNLPRRNLGRDDRVVSDHGRQLRTPYLDERLLDFVLKLQVWERTYPTNDLQGTGDIYLLRNLAKHIGLNNAATFKKRALQFGSRIADSKENANDVSPRL